MTSLANFKFGSAVALTVLLVAGCGGGGDGRDVAIAIERVESIPSSVALSSPPDVPVARAGDTVEAAAIGSLSVVIDTSSTGADLTQAGRADWVHWGDGLPGTVRKAAGGGAISQYTVLGGTPSSYSGDPRALSWTDGEPIVSATANTGGVAVSSAGGGFLVWVPAGTGVRTAIVYVGGRDSAGTFRAHLTDGSTGGFNATTTLVSGRYNRTYTITYSAASQDQRLVLTWTQASDAGSVALSAVALGRVNYKPLLTTPTARSSVVGRALSVTVRATDADRDTLVFSAIGLPEGLTIDAFSGVISGTPTTVGDAFPTISVSDGRGGSDSGAFALRIVLTLPPASGLDSRPANLSCVAPARPQGGTGIQLARVFPNLSFNLPVGMMQAPGDSTRWYVLEQQSGLVRHLPNKQDAQPADIGTFLNLSGRILVGSETGLLGLAFHPQWPGTPQVFVYYTVVGASPVENRVSRYVSSDGGATLDPASEQVILRLVKNQNTTNHNGGNIAFGPDGFLYIGTGDGGGAGDPNNNAQNRNVLFGKMLRLDVSPANGYAIPTGITGNPFAGNPQCVNGSGGAPCPEIFAYGLRNPWRWSFDRATGDLWLGDVGQSTREEINVVRRGANLGWRLREGSLCYTPAIGCGTTGANGEPLVDPVVEYGRDAGRAVTGGYVYRGSQVSALAGRYVFADYASSRLFTFLPPDPLVAATPRLVLTAADTLLTAPQNVTSMAQGHDGELYVVGYGGQLFGLQPAGDAIDTIPTLLSQTGCVSATDATQPAAGLIPVDVAAPFWSDGAVKQRWLALPDGTAMTPQAPGRWTAPNGTVLMKSFRLDDKLVETRLLMRHPDGVWAGYTYEWNVAQTDATRVVGGKTKIVDSQTWIYPSENDCLTCHTEVAGRTLGLETAQLNADVTYPATGRTANQITTLTAVGLLSPPLAGAPAKWPAYADPHGSAGTVRERARAFLHANCSQCHQPGGPTPVALDLRHTTALAQTGACNVAPAGGDLGLSNARLIAPGKPDRSVLLARVNRRDASGMPPLGSTVVDNQSVAVLREWIEGLTGCR